MTRPRLAGGFSLPTLTLEYRMSTPSVLFRGGRLREPNPDRRSLHFEDYLTGDPLPPPPADADWLSEVTDWPMYANDSVGDCTLASPGHMIEAFTRYAQGVAVEITEADVLAAYSAVTGYRPGDPSTDTGAVIEDVLKYWRDHGIGGHKILAYGKVDVSNRTHVEQAIYLFGAVNLGVNLPQSAEDQFNAGQPWQYVKGSPIIGGHCVPALRYRHDGSTDVITWAAVVKVMGLFWRHFVEEGWFVLTKDRANQLGNSPSGFNLFQLGEDLAALTGDPNPIPAPTPTPVPPTPAPDPSPCTGAQVVAAMRDLFKKMGF